MSFISTVQEKHAQGDVARIYNDVSRNFGYLPNMVRPFSHAPDVFDAWEALSSAIRAGMDLWTYELATLGAARVLKSSYCMLAHGKIAMREGMDPSILRVLAETGRSDRLSPRDAAIFAYAGKVANDASSITQADIDALKAHGLSDADIFQVAAAASLRCFFSKLLDALGTEPDAAYRELPVELRDALQVGRGIAATQAQTSA